MLSVASYIVIFIIGMLSITSNTIIIIIGMLSVASNDLYHLLVLPLSLSFGCFLLLVIIFIIGMLSVGSYTVICIIWMFSEHCKLQSVSLGCFLLLVIPNLYHVDAFCFQFEEKGNQLVILQPDVSHSGFYQCLVENEAGFELAFGRLEIYLQSE